MSELWFSGAHLRLAAIRWSGLRKIELQGQRRDTALVVRSVLEFSVVLEHLLLHEHREHANLMVPIFTAEELTIMAVATEKLAKKYEWMASPWDRSSIGHGCGSSTCISANRRVWMVLFVRT
jgi:hypothetical protein